MENLYYDKNYLKSLRTYLRENFAEVSSSYRYRNYVSHRGIVTTKFRGVVLTAKNANCSMRFEIWGGTPLVEITFIFGKKDKTKFFRSYSEIGSGIFGDLTREEFRFVNQVLSKASTTGNNALDFITNL